MPYRLLFFGTSDFAVPSLQTLIHDDRFEIVGIITQPDRPVGRHAILTAPPVKKVADEENIHPIWQPEKLTDTDFNTWLTGIGTSCDAFVVVSYGKILPQWLLDLPKQGVINVHGSLLPRWRGASPIQAAIAAGDRMTGVTIMKMDALLDHGPILSTVGEPIHDTDTGTILHDRLAKQGGNILPSALYDYLEGKIRPREQEHDLAIVCRTLNRDDGKIDWNKTAQEIERLIRAYTPWPGTWTEWQGKRLKILSSQLTSQPSIIRPLGDLYIQNDHLLVVCGHGTNLELSEVQLEGKKPINGRQLRTLIK